MGVERKVTGCNDCPCCDMLDMAAGYQCSLVDSQEMGYIKESKTTYMAETPDWCPIKKEGKIVLTFNDNPPI